MILYVHSKFLPLSTFVVSVEASWTIRRVRGAILHNLSEIGHHRHPFRLRYKGAYLQDRLTLYESKIYDNVAVELVPLATHGELQARVSTTVRKYRRKISMFLSENRRILD